LPCPATDAAPHPTSTAPSTTCLTTDAFRDRPSGDVRPAAARPMLFVRPSVPVLEPDDVVQFRRRYLEDVGVLDCRHPMHGLRGDVHRLARKHLAPHQPAIDFDLEQQLAGPEIDRLVLLVVVLQAQRVALRDVDHLPHVPIRLGPVQFVTPGLVDLRYLTHAGSLTERFMASRMALAIDASN